jgi:thymidylate synthase
MSHDDDVTMIKAYAPQYANFAEDDGRAYGAYGKRFAVRLPAVIDVLRHDPDSRQAVVSLWEPRDLAQKKRDVPCTISWQFFVRNNALHMHCHMRSNDVWLGLPYDVFVNTLVQRVVASELLLPVGEYCHTVGSMHLYEKHEAAAKEAMYRAPLGSGPLGWPDYCEFTTLQNTADAVKNEKHIRDGLEPRVMYGSDVLHDALVVCARKWGRDQNCEARSPMFKRRLEC